MEAALGSPLFNTPPSDSSAYQELPEMTYPNTPPPFILTPLVDGEERSVEITMEEQNSTASFHTAHSGEPGTRENPIDVDQLFIREDTPHLQQDSYDEQTQTTSLR